MSGPARRAGTRVAVGCVGLVLPLATALAAPAVSAADLARCAGIAGADERLACYDALARPALPRPPAAAAAPPAVREFGLTPHPASVEAAADNIKAVVQQVSSDRLGNVTVVLDNGQTWSFSDPDTGLRAGDAVTIKKASLGSFLLVAPNHRSFRAHRLR